MLHIKKEELIINAWSGGTTTQLYIYPKESLYKNLDFSFRISTATIDVEESSFTTLPNVNRTLMILNGEITIQHQNKYSKQLKKFDTDTFNGEWQTSSIGKATDFNVMIRGAAIGSAQGFSLKENQQKEINDNDDFLLLYVYSGKIEANNFIANQGDVLVFEKEKISIQAITSSDIALATIKL